MYSALSVNISVVKLNNRICPSSGSLPGTVSIRFGPGLSVTVLLFSDLIRKLTPKGFLRGGGGTRVN